MKFYYQDYFELTDKEIAEFAEGLKQGIDFEVLFEEYIGCDSRRYLVYDQVKEFFEKYLQIKIYDI